jgi:hypothetical protein
MSEGERRFASTVECGSLAAAVARRSLLGGDGEARNVIPRILKTDHDWMACKNAGLAARRRKVALCFYAGGVKGLSPVVGRSEHHRFRTVAQQLVGAGMLVVNLGFSSSISPVFNHPWYNIRSIHPQPR